MHTKESKLLSHVVLFDAIKYEGNRAAIIATYSHYLTILQLKRARGLPRHFEADIDNNRSIIRIGVGRAKMGMYQ